ncbi:MAG: hypothetical protein JNJ54_28230 [Myxococcaceae bacterium]|nr:hypothetical protein [Myxococcaceae bacterium]
MLLVARAAFAGEPEDDKDQDAEDAAMLEKLLGGSTAGAPPEVKAVMKKMQDGDDLTPAEERTLQQWMMKKSGQQVPSKSNTVDELPFDAPAQCVGATQTKALADGPWKTLSAELKKTFAAKLGPKLVAQLDATIAKAKRPVDVADLGAALFIGGAFHGAGYVLLVHLGKVPGDHVALSHLGLVLAAVGRAKDSVAVHLRAAAATKAALVRTNTGHALLRAGDCAAAHAAFDVAEASVPTYGPMLSGQAMVAALEGRDADAMKYLRASRRQGHSPATESVVSEAVDETERRPSPQPAPEASPDRRVWWPRVTPITVPMPPVGVGIDQLVGNLNLGTEWLVARKQELDSAAKRTQAAVDAVKAARTAQAQRVRLGPSVTLPMPDGPAVSAFWAAYRDYDEGMRARTAAMKQALDPTMKDLGFRYGQSLKQQADETRSRCGPKASPECIEAVGFEFCQRRKSLASFAVQHFEGSWPAYAGGTKQALERFWLEAGRPMEGVGDAATKKMLYEFRRTIVRRDVVALGGVVTAWRAGMASGVYDPEGKSRASCVKPQPPGPPPEPVPDPPLTPARGCSTPGKLKTKAFFFSAELSCDSIKTEFNEGINFAREENLRTGETTTFLGVGATLEAGIAELGGKQGGYLTVNAAGQPIDAGMYSSGSVSIFGPELEFGGRIGLSGIQVGAAASVMTPGPVAVGAEAWSGSLEVNFEGVPQMLLGAPAAP